MTSDPHTCETCERSCDPPVTVVVSVDGRIFSFRFCCRLCLRRWMRAVGRLPNIGLSVNRGGG